LTISIFQRPVAATLRAIFSRWYPTSAKTLVIAILYFCRQDAYAEQKPERVDKNLTFAADDLLARVETLQINRCTCF
jgi:hypothetical protein